MAMSLGVFVLFEPAPVDLAIMAVLIMGFIFGKPSLRSHHALPAALLASGNGCATGVHR
jgi:hypothetical protein